jgi:UDP-2,3-diacylglucosamine hydrolase
MTTLFISDLHLEESRPDITDAFLRFLREDATQANTLYILGDLFEAWIGDDNHTALNNQITNALKTLTDRGVAIFVMHGNRDFLLGDEFAKQTGSKIINDPTIIDLYGKPALLMHGDTLCTNDVEYLKFRAQVRHPLFQQDFLSKTLQERAAIAKHIRDVSKTEGQNKAYEIMDVTPQAVIDVMAQHNVDLLIHGHTHRPATHNLTVSNKPAQRIVLGDWDKNPRIIKADKNGYSLVSYPLN